MIRLSRRQYELLRHLADGLTMPEAADRMFITLSSVKKHRSSLSVKLGGGTSARLVAQGFRQGLLGLDGQTDVDAA